MPRLKEFAGKVEKKCSWGTSVWVEKNVRNVCLYPVPLDGRAVVPLSRQSMGVIVTKWVSSNTPRVDPGGGGAALGWRAIHGQPV